MKKLCALLALFSLTLVAGAEQAASWSFNDKGTTITDGEWTFNVSRRDGYPEVAAGVKGLWIKKCVSSPASASTLDFGKSVPEYDG